MSNSALLRKAMMSRGFICTFLLLGQVLEAGCDGYVDPDIWISMSSKDRAVETLAIRAFIWIKSQHTLEGEPRMIGVENVKQRASGFRKVLFDLILADTNVQRCKVVAEEVPGTGMNYMSDCGV